MYLVYHVAQPSRPRAALGLLHHGLERPRDSQHRSARFEPKALPEGTCWPPPRSCRPGGKAGTEGFPWLVHPPTHPVQKCYKWSSGPLSPTFPKESSPFALSSHSRVYNLLHYSTSTLSAENCLDRAWSGPEASRRAGTASKTN